MELVPGTLEKRSAGGGVWREACSEQLRFCVDFETNILRQVVFKLNLYQFNIYKREGMLTLQVKMIEYTKYTR